MNLTRIRKILLATLLLSVIAYNPEANEKGIRVRDKLIPENSRLTNSLSEGGEYAGIEKSVNNFMKRWSISGASIAITKNGRLVYARGFGYADTASHSETQPFNKFRVASISKLVTAAAVLKLVEEGKISLNQRVFGTDAILNDSVFCHPKDKRVYGITVAHLLSHEGGWTTRWGDQMFMPTVVAGALGVRLPVDTRTIVRFALGKSLHFTPGTGKAYSNLGYSILGLVIEKASGMPYEEYCKKALLEPVGIYDMTLAHNMPGQKAPYEVTYYQPTDVALKPSIYGTGEMMEPSYGGNDIEALGAAGAWIATAPDLARLMLALDGLPSRPDILSASSIQFMTDESNGYAPVGWKGIRADGEWWRTGSFPGSAGMIKKGGDGTGWVVLFNSSAWNGPEIYSYINNLMFRVTSQVKEWTANDLFNYSLPFPLNVSQTDSSNSR